MTNEEAERLILGVLSEFEGTVRTYLRAIEEDSPAKADAYWKAVFNLRVQIISEFEFMRLALKQAKYAKDPG